MFCNYLSVSGNQEKNKKRMKKILTNTITLFAEIIALIIGIIWLSRSDSSNYHEPLILVILSLTSFITTWILKTKELPNLEIRIIPNGKGAKPTQPSSKTPRNDEGIPVMQYENMIGKRELYWKYIVKVINNSSIIAFSPELYVYNGFCDINFIGDLSINSPIKGTEFVDLEITFTKWTDGSSNKNDADHKPTFPPEVINRMKMIIKYSSGEGENIYKKFEFENNEGKNKIVRKIPNSFSKANIYPRTFK